MEKNFSNNMSLLRRARGLSQRRVAADLNISQALLSHYENGAREPGLPFVCRACRYYGVSADFMLGLTQEHENHRAGEETLAGLVEGLRELTSRAEKALEELNK